MAYSSINNHTATGLKISQLTVALLRCYGSQVALIRTQEENLSGIFDCIPKGIATLHTYQNQQMHLVKEW